MSRFGRVAFGVVAALSLGAFGLQPALAQTRMIASLADVQAYNPAPYHPHTMTAIYGASLYDQYPYLGSAYLAAGARYWH
jgi:hypothetical protein